MKRLTRNLVTALLTAVAILSVGLIGAPAAGAHQVSTLTSATALATGATDVNDSDTGVATAVDPVPSDPGTVGADAYNPTTTTDPSTQTNCVKTPDGSLSCPENAAGQIRYTGNAVCVSTQGSVSSWVDALFYNGTRTQLLYGKCSYNNPSGFSVPNGHYCDSQWGYRYNGDWFGRAYSFSSNNNTLRLSCHHA